ncbi:DUF2231 domain-containing protein [Microvirga terrestris]|uniref:DUF2231 domain-containing protein n=1 Tax=Microvirga terrestris TaxID=2791024 RepID=A0ABS0HT20_9HYPH|nr:DUF2231 domain-containing protein [Microvirga terrestris]MBF9196634.1 DUF2231 domain-containing protein [Microvirga terrestris]
MGRYHRHGVQSTAAIAGHPLHHMLIVFPVAFLIGALGTDIVFMATQDQFWAQCSYWLLIAGIVTALVAAVPGMIDFVTIDRVRNIWISWAHMVDNLVVVALALINVGVRSGDPAAGVQGWGIWLSSIQTALLLFSGWLGGEMAYRYGIGAIQDYSPKVEQFHVEVDRADVAEHYGRRSGSGGL